MDSALPNAATDQPADGADQARVCARPGCSNPALKGSTGRPRTYCSRSCHSKVDRAKAKAREEAAAEVAAPAAAVAARDVAAAESAAAPAAAAREAAHPADDDRWGGDGRYLLSLADALRRKLTAFLEETENGDPVAAFKELTLRLPGYSSRVFATAQDIRDKARWPDLTQSERVTRRVLERVDLWGDDADQADDDQDQDDDGSAPRGETADADEDQEHLVPAGPAAAEPTPPVVLPHQQDDDPRRSRTCVAWAATT